MIVRALAEPAIVPYAASKAGLDALIKGLARELAPRRAVGVAPGWLDTEMTQAHARLYGAEFKEALEKRSPAGAATVESIVDAIAFLNPDLFPLWGLDEKAWTSEHPNPYH